MRWNELLLLGPACVVLAACGERAGERADSSGPAADESHVGSCAVDPSAGALIGEIVGLGTDPATGQTAYRVLVDAGGGRDTSYVGAGVRVVDCSEARANQSKQNPEPAPVSR